jgi:hypothetical protein
MKVGSTAGVISGLSPGAEKAGEVPNGTTDIVVVVVVIIIIIIIKLVCTQGSYRMFIYFLYIQLSSFSVGKHTFNLHRLASPPIMISIHIFST